MEYENVRQYAPAYATLSLVALLLVEPRNAIGSLDCPANLVAKLSFLSFVELATSLFLTFQNLKNLFRTQF